MDPSFTSLWQEGYQHYLSGEWTEARKVFKECQKLRPADGPCKTLLGIINEHNGKAPERWKGFRALISK